MRKYLAALLVCFNVAASAQELATVDQAARAGELCRPAIKEKLKDPDSAAFSPFSAGMLVNGQWFFPVRVKARNSFGGMADTVAFTCFLDRGLTRVVEVRH